MKRISFFLLYLVLAGNFFYAGIPPQRGIIVESVEQGSAAEKAGIKAGDMLLSWKRESSGGVFRTPFDLFDVEMNEAPKGTVTLTLKRGVAVSEFQLASADWEIDTTNLIACSAKAVECWNAFRAGEEACAGKEWEESIKCYDKAIECAALNKLESAWIQVLFKKAAALKKKKDLQGALICLDSALEKSRLPLVTAELLAEKASAYDDMNDREQANKIYLKALEIFETEVPGSVTMARLLHDFGTSRHNAGDLESAEKYYTRALSIKENLSPGSADTAVTANNLGVMEFQRGNLPKAEAYHMRCLEIRTKEEPGSLRLAATYNNLGITYHQMGDMKRAEDFYKRALQIKEALAPKSVDTAITLNNVGLAAFNGGDYETAEQYYKKALEVYRSMDYNGTQKTYPLNNLALLNCQRGDLDLAEKYYADALSIRKAQAPDSIEVATILHNIGLLAQEKGDIPKARSLYEESLAIKHSKAPGSPDEAKTIDALAQTYLEDEDWKNAESLYKESLAITERSVPRSLLNAQSLFNLGNLYFRKGYNREAEVLFRQSLEIYGNLARGSWQEALVLRYMGVISLGRGDLAEGTELLSRSVDAIEIQKGKLGGSFESQERFSTAYTDIYKELIDAQVELDRPGDALLTLERYRARVLLNLLAERDLFFSGDIPEELIIEQNMISHEYEKARAKMNLLSPHADSAEIAELSSKISSLKEQQADIRDKIKKTSPRLGMLKYPEPLPISGISGLLDDRTLLLSFSVGEKHTLLFSMFGGTLKEYNIPAGRKELSTKVRRLRSLISAPTGDYRELSDCCLKLYALLLRPAQKEIRKAGQVIICPDESLHYLPFCALKPSRGKWFASKTASSNVISATVLNEIRGSRTMSRNQTGLAAFAAPVYSSDLPDSLPPLPASLGEVEDISLLFPGNARLFTGIDASERNAAGSMLTAKYVHFACHGKLNETTPLDSYLALSPSENCPDSSCNGRLQAWEIFERVRTDADLVTLSACETGLGKEMGGEGLIGLTRAFQYAGAKTVLSSLWSVSDESTAILMKNFYSNLKQGKTKAEALRLAQVDMVKSKNYSHPFYWAGFILNGDWK
jgi:CHAT domain-containing protein/Tfp pilus assembly protein PilF